MRRVQDVPPADGYPIVRIALDHDVLAVLAGHVQAARRVRRARLLVVGAPVPQHEPLPGEHVQAEVGHEHARVVPLAVRHLAGGDPKPGPLRAFSRG